MAEFSEAVIRHVYKSIFCCEDYVLLLRKLFNNIYSRVGVQKETKQPEVYPVANILYLIKMFQRRQ